MMKFVHTNIETPIELTSDRVFVLIFENSSDFYFKVNDFLDLFNGEENKLSFWQKDKMIKPEKYGEIVPNLFSFDLNNKRVISLLHKRIEADFFSGEGIIKLNEINTKIMTFYKDSFFDFPFTLEYDELALLDILKASDIRFKDDYNTLLERLICYVNILAELKNLQFIVFVNLKSVLGDKELKQLYHHCQNEKVSLLLLESSKIRPLLPEEKAVIITDDLCEIVENFS